MMITSHTEPVEHGDGEQQPNIAVQNWFDFFVRPRLLDEFLSSDSTSMQDVYALHDTLIAQIFISAASPPSQSTSVSPIQHQSSPPIDLPSPPPSPSFSDTSDADHTAALGARDTLGHLGKRLRRLLRLESKCIVVLLERFSQRLLEDILSESRTPLGLRRLILEQLVMMHLVVSDEMEVEGESSDACCYFSTELQRWILRGVTRDVSLRYLVLEDPNNDASFSIGTEGPAQHVVNTPTATPASLQPYGQTVTGLKEDAIAYLERALNQTHRHMPPHINGHILSFEIQHDLGQSFFADDNFMRARDYFERALANYTQHLITDEQRKLVSVDLTRLQKLVVACQVMTDSFKDEQTLSMQIEHLKRRLLDVTAPPTDAERWELENSIISFLEEDILEDSLSIAYRDNTFIEIRPYISFQSNARILASNFAKKIVSMPAHSRIWKLPDDAILNKFTRDSPMIIHNELAQVLFIETASSVLRQRNDVSTNSKLHKRFSVIVDAIAQRTSSLPVLAAILTSHFANDKHRATFEHLFSSRVCPTVLSDHMDVYPEPVKSFLQNKQKEESAMRSNLRHVAVDKRPREESLQETNQVVSLIEPIECLPKRAKREESIYILHNAREMMFRGEYRHAAELVQYALIQLQAQNEVLPSEYRVDAIVLNLALSVHNRASDTVTPNRRILHQDQFDTLINDVHGRGILPPVPILGEILKHLVNTNDWAFIKQYFSKILQNIPVERTEERGICVFAQNLENVHAYASNPSQSKRLFRDSIYHLLDSMLIHPNMVRFQQQHEQQQHFPNVSVNGMVHWGFVQLLSSMTNNKTFQQQLISIVSFALYCLRRSYNYQQHGFDVHLTEKYKSLAMKCGDLFGEELWTSSLSSTYRQWSKSGYEPLIDKCLMTIAIELLRAKCKEWDSNDAAANRDKDDARTTHHRPKRRHYDLLSLGNLYFECRKYRSALLVYLKASSLSSNDYHDNKIATNVMTTRVIERMVRCLMQLRETTAAAVLYQFLHRGFDKTMVNELKSPDERWLIYFYDIPSLEMLLYISHWNKDERKEKMLMRFMERMELNVNNPPEKRNRFVNELKVAFLRRLENHLYTLDSE